MIDSRQAAFLQEMGLGPVWSRRAPAPLPASAPETIAEAVNALTTDSVTTFFDEPAVPVVEFASVPALQNGSDIAHMDWEQLKAAVAPCTKCGLCKSRTQTVFGVGDQKAKWLFVGEGPGRNEDAQGLPFVGPAGKLLDNMLVAMGLKRGENTYIANIVKCRPTDASRRDRPPEPAEANACMPYLQRQIELIDPAVIVALGKTAALSLLQLDPATPVGKLRGTVHRYAGKPLVVTYHPAYLLRTPGDKRKVWADLCLAMQSHDAAGK
ncbi:MAG TPA: uracil-DNA glycosylase [Oxalicibacterium sp.]|nr:uracil-DNA glycosylase [Oxalicibacterium sp.]